MPELQRMEADVPILLVGCKSDLRQPGQSLQQVAVASPSPFYEQASIHTGVSVALQRSRSRPA